MSKNLPEWLEISDLYTLRAQYTVRRKNLPRYYGIATLVYAVLFFVASWVAHLTWPKSGLASLLALVCPLVGVVDWIWTTHKIESLTAKIAKTGVDLRV